jgi:hypothetical protein
VFRAEVFMVSTSVWVVGCSPPSENVTGLSLASCRRTLEEARIHKYTDTSQIKCTES